MKIAIAVSNNFRNNVVFDVINILKLFIDIISCELVSKDKKNNEIKVLNNLNELEKCDIILANRIDENLEKYKNKVFSRDIYRNN